jgi:hypothetical protein
MNDRTLRKVENPPRTGASAEQITALIYESIRVVPSLATITVRVVRLPLADADGCNWVAKHSAMPANHPPGAARILFDVIANARRHFNLWDVD